MTRMTMRIVPMFMPFSSRSPYPRLLSPETDDRRPSDPLPIVCFDGTEFPDRSDGHDRREEMPVSADRDWEAAPAIDAVGQAVAKAGMAWRHRRPRPDSRPLPTECTAEPRVTRGSHHPQG